MWQLVLYVTPQGKCPLEDFIQSIDDSKLKAKVLADLDLLEAFGIALTAPHAKTIIDPRGKLYELRSKQSSNITRIFYFY